MSEYSNLSKEYYHLFNAVTAQISALEHVEKAVPPGDFVVSRGIAAVIAALKAVQCETEEMFIGSAG